MIDSGQSQSLLKRTLFAMGAMVGASAIFVTTLTVLLVVLADRAVAPPASDKTDTRAAATAPTAATPPTAKGPASATPKPGGGRS